MSGLEDSRRLPSRASGIGARLARPSVAERLVVFLPDEAARVAAGMTGG